MRWGCNGMNIILNEIRIKSGWMKKQGKRKRRQEVEERQELKGDTKGKGRKKDSKITIKPKEGYVHRKHNQSLCLSYIPTLDLGCCVHKLIKTSGKCFHFLKDSGPGCTGRTGTGVLLARVIQKVSYCNKQKHLKINVNM